MSEPQMTSGGTPSIDQLLAEVSTCIGKLGGEEEQKRPTYLLEIMGVFDRCRSALGAARILVKNGHSHEALSLGRQVFLESLMLMELASVNETRRVDIVVGWSLHGLGEFEGVFKEARTRGDDVSAELEAVRNERGRLHEMRARAGVKGRTWTPQMHAKELAKKHDRYDEYLDYLVTHHFVHGSNFAVAQRWSKDDAGHIRIGGDTAAVEVWEPTGLATAFSALHAGRAMCHIAGWDEPPDLARLLVSVEKANDAFSSTPDGVGNSVEV